MGRLAILWQRDPALSDLYGRKLFGKDAQRKSRHCVTTGEKGFKNQQCEDGDLDVHKTGIIGQGGVV